MDNIRIKLNFRATGFELTEGDEIHAVFVRPDASPAEPELRLKGDVIMTRITPDEISETEVFTARLECVVTPDIEPGKYVCEGLYVQDLEERDWPFTDKDKLDLVLHIREQPSYELWAVASEFFFDQQT